MGGCLWFALLVAACPAHGFDLVLKDAPVHLYFSPQGGAQAGLVAAIGRARKSLLVQAYSFTSGPVEEALKAAHDRGVDVRVILDRSQRNERSGMGFLIRAGIPTWIDPVHAIAHNKVMVVDGRTVVTGSFNYTRAAEERNAENLLILESPELADYYAKNWQTHLQHSEPVD
jgi:phosphatidylserine/phosphatidylglycerophosphate/cardiolipin synthase-like enzyme